jgi:hypothetical protein
MHARDLRQEQLHPTGRNVAHQWSVRDRRSAVVLYLIDCCTINTCSIVTTATIEIKIHTVYDLRNTVCCVTSVGYPSDFGRIGEGSQKGLLYLLGL